MAGRAGRAAAGETSRHGKPRARFFAGRVDKKQEKEKTAKAKLLKNIANAVQYFSTNSLPTNSEGDHNIPPSNGIQIQRVTTQTVTSSTNPTDPRVLQTKPQTHQQHTHANTPGMMPLIVSDTNHTPLIRK